MKYQQLFILIDRTDHITDSSVNWTLRNKFYDVLLSMQSFFFKNIISNGWRQSVIFLSLCVFMNEILV